MTGTRILVRKEMLESWRTYRLPVVAGLFVLVHMGFRWPNGQFGWWLLGLTLWTTWQASTAAGLYLGARIPTSWHLEFALPLTFLALARPAVTDRATAITVLVASVVGIVSYGLAMRLGIIVAALAGIAAGIVAEAWGGPRG